jgi:plastocyanin
MKYLRGSIVGLCAAGAIAVSACGNGVPQPSGSGGGGGSAAGTAGANLGTAAVTIDATDNLQFSPSSQTAKVGQVVGWKNTGSVLHNITFDTEGALTDSALAPGGSWEVKFSKAGTYSFKCTIHPGMDGKITVS